MHANARFSRDVELSVELSIDLAVVDLFAGILMPGIRRAGLIGTVLAPASNSGVVGLIVADDTWGIAPVMIGPSRSNFYSSLMHVPRIVCALPFL